jgi:pimeloyl-ACP methyl ester carboxylesterase
MAREDYVYGVFGDGIPFVRFGSGKKDMIVFPGGPGNTLPTGMGLRMFSKGFQPFFESYTVHFASRKSGLPEGYTTRDFSNDYAEMIRTEFGGHVDLVVGMSFGGMIAQYFAADHSELSDCMVIAMAAHRMSEEGKRVDYRYAELVSQGKDRKAMASLSGVLFRGRIWKPLVTFFSWSLAGFFAGDLSDTYREDVMIEAEAEISHDASESLRRIKVPVLIICGDEDFFFPLQYVKETAERIEKSTLKIYEGKGHGMMSEKRFARDILAFIEMEGGSS